VQVSWASILLLAWTSCCSWNKALCVCVCVCVIRVFLCNMILFSLDLDLHFGVLQIFWSAKNVAKGMCHL
jgi:hypothetical protein